MNGGRLVQHQGQSGYIHEIETTKYGRIKVSSTHHQAAYVDDMKIWDYRLIGWTTNESKYHLDGNENEMNPKKEVEMVYYPKTKSFGCQSHPEYNDYQTRETKSLKVIQQIFLDFIQGNFK